MDVANDRKHWVVLGRIVRVHGVRGALRVRWYSPLDALTGPLQSVQLSLDGGPGQVFAIDALREQGDEGALLHLAGLADIDAATPWRGAEVRVARALVQPAEDGEVYLFELLGRHVYDVTGKLLGRVQNLYDYGAGPLLGILPPLPAVEPAVEPAKPASLRPRRGQRRRKGTAAKRDEVLLPLLPKVLRELDLASDRVVVDTAHAGLQET